MKTATTDNPGAPVGDASPELFSFTFNPDGVCENPEVVKVTLPGKATCEIELARTASGAWVTGWAFFDGKSEGAQTPCRQGLEVTSRGERCAALKFGLQAAAKFFQRSKPTLKALEAFHATLETEAAAARVEAAPCVPRTYHTEFVELPVKRIQRNPDNHRKHFDAEKLRELADSLRSEGLHQPIAARELMAGEIPEGELPLGDPGAPAYELIFGERRWRAAQLAEIAVLTARVYRGLTRLQARSIALVENLQRVDINAMEEAEGLAALMEGESLTQEQCADRVGKRRSTVANALRLLKLPATVKESIREGKLTAAHGVALARFADWPVHLAVMAEAAILNKASAESLERGVPSSHALASAGGLAVRISQWGEHKVTDKLKKHPAYFACGDGDWMCFEPEHWEKECGAREEAARAKEEKERAQREAELAKQKKRGRTQLRLEDLNADTYRELTGTDAALLALVPEDKRAAAKGLDGKPTTVVTDVEFAERLSRAMRAAIKANRVAVAKDLEAKVVKRCAALKKFGAREFAWLVWSASKSNGINLSTEAATRAGVKLPPGACVPADDESDAATLLAYRERRLEVLAKCEPAEVARVLIAEQLPAALERLVECGPNSFGGSALKWWLDTDTLWLLEETDEGRAELLEQVKTVPAVAKMLAGAAGDEGEK